VSVAPATRSTVRRLALAQAVSFAGGTSAYVALTSDLYTRTGSAVWVAATGAVSFALPALISPVSGALGDRFDRRAVMVYSDLLGAACFVALALLSAPAALIAVKALAAIVAAPFFPASAAAIPRLVPEADLPRANASVASWGTAGALVGPLFGGTATVLLGASGVFATNAVTFLVSAFLISSLSGNLKPGAEPHHQHQGLGAGLRLLLADRTLRALTVGFGFLFVGIGTTLPAEIVRVQDLGVGAGGYGAMIAVWAAGGLIGAQLAGRILRRFSSMSVLASVSVGIVAAFALVAIAPWFGLLLFGMVIGGLAEGLGEVAHRLLVQRRAPDEVLSRVFAATSATEQVAYTLPLLYTGLLVDSWGAAVVFGVASGICGLGVACFVWLWVRGKGNPV
jgi:MFS family permease